MQHFIDRRLVDSLDSVRIVHRHNRIREPGSGKIDASIFNHEGVQVQLDSKKLPFFGADLLVLLFEEGEDGWSVFPAVGDAGETDAGVVGLVERRIVEENLDEVPHGVGGVDAAWGGFVGVCAWPRRIACELAYHTEKIIKAYHLPTTRVVFCPGIPVVSFKIVTFPMIKLNDTFWKLS